MKFIRLTKENIEKEHICCCISDKKCRNGYEAKKKWLNSQFPNGYTLKKLDVRGKVFIEYTPVEYAWSPIDAQDYMMINCFWVSGRYKNSGYGKALYGECVKDSKGKNGIVVITSNKKQPYLSDKFFFKKQGFELGDTAGPYFELWYKRLKKDSPVPKFKRCSKGGECNNKDGITVYYTEACPFTEYYVNVELAKICEDRGYRLKIIKINSREQAQNHLVPYSNYSIFYKGKFVTHQILNEKNFNKFIWD